MILVLSTPRPALRQMDWHTGVLRVLSRTESRILRAIKRQETGDEGGLETLVVKKLDSEDFGFGRVAHWQLISHHFHSLPEHSFTKLKMLKQAAKIHRIQRTQCHLGTPSGRFQGVVGFFDDQNVTDASAICGVVCGRIEFRLFQVMSAIQVGVQDIAVIQPSTSAKVTYAIRWHQSPPSSINYCQVTQLPQVKGILSRIQVI
ncbi:hypothetical protein R3P38DRAFT_2760088 [Favolaschia claudopus]|uniref:Uncharacterized protein n=1 Tax=Favolaschia claudopus TaxID=2862362 RepID=A0AAW0E2C6_9AGAR